MGWRAPSSTPQRRDGDVDALLDEDALVALGLELGLASRQGLPDAAPGLADALAGLGLGARRQRTDLAVGEIGALPPSAKAEAGKRVGQARGRVGQALTARQAELEAERDERILVEERMDVTVPALVARWAPATPSARLAAVVDIFVGMGWEIAEGPEVECEWLNFDALNLGPTIPPADAGHLLRRPASIGLVLRTHTSPVQIRTMLSRSRRSTSWPRARSSAPTTSTRRTPRSSTSSRASPSTRASPWRTSAARSTRSSTCSVRHAHPPAQDFPFTEPSVETDCLCFDCGGQET